MEQTNIHIKNNKLDLLLLDIHNKEELEKKLNLELPEKYSSYNDILKEKIIKYLFTLDETEIIAYKIAKNHLGSSFNLIKSNGFINWQVSNK
jgi:hypothetical protein